MRYLFLIGAAGLVAACDGSTDPAARLTPMAGFLNATAAKLDVAVDGANVLTSVAASTITSLDMITIPPGAHEIRVRTAGATTGGATFTLQVAADGTPNLIAYQGPGAALSARALEDTGAFVPAGKSKVRVINLAPNSDIDIWRTQPDYQSPITFQFPFPFNPDPGPYLQSDAGVWQVWITPTSNASNRLHETGPLNIPSGQKRTIVVVDSAGVLRLRVLLD